MGCLPLLKNPSDQVKDCLPWLKNPSDQIMDFLPIVKKKSYQGMNSFFFCYSSHVIMK